MSCVETIRDLSRRLSSDLARDFRVALVQRRPLNFGRIMLDYAEYFDAHVRCDGVGTFFVRCLFYYDRLRGVI